MHLGAFFTCTAVVTLATREPGFQVSGFRFRVSGFGFRVSGFRYRVSGFGFRVSSFGVWDSCPSEKIQVSGFTNRFIINF